MRKVNLFLIFIIILVSVFLILGETDQGIVVILKDSSIVLTLLFPYILKRVFNIDIDEKVVFVWIIFIFLAHFLGVICSLYFKIDYFDKVAHTFSGVLSGFVGMMILNNVKIKSTIFRIIFILSFSALCAVCWEIFEFTCNALFGGDAQRVLLTGVNDTMGDMIVALIGSSAVCLYYYLRKNKYSLFYTIFFSLIVL